MTEMNNILDITETLHFQTSPEYKQIYSLSMILNFMGEMWLGKNVLKVSWWGREDNEKIWETPPQWHNKDNKSDLLRIPGLC